ncbi:flagellar biosynthetic protein FliR [Planctomycetota bacterium]
MLLMRISAFFMVIPVFSWKSIPIRIKVSLTVLLTIFFSMITLPKARVQQASVLEAVLMLINEGTYGLALGLIASLLFGAVKFGGRIVERQMGLAMASILDPLTGDRTQPLGSLLEMMFVLLFLSANGHHLFLLTLSKSYEAFPAGSIPSISILAGGIIRAGSTMLIAGLKLAAPMLAAFLLLLVVLAILARMVPEMNILFISLPLRVGLGLLMVVVFLPLLSTFVSEFADLMGKLLPI